MFATDSLPHVTGSSGLTLSLMLRPETATGTINIASLGNSLSISATDLTPRVQIGNSSMTATSMLTAGGWNHLALVYRPAIVPGNGWRYGGFSKRPTGLTEDCCYAVNTDAKEYYFLKTPGPFAEAKEMIGGFWIWQVNSQEEALEWVKRCPISAHAESEIELRQVLDVDDFAARIAPEFVERTRYVAA